MTHDELIDVLAKHGAALDGWDWDSNTTFNGNSVEEEHARYREWIADTLTAIEAAGLAIVPVDATPGLLGAWYRVKNGFHYHGEPEPTDKSDYTAYRAMIEAGKI